MTTEPNSPDKNEGTEPLAVIEEAATGTGDQPDIGLAKLPFLRPLLKPAFWVIMFSLLAGLYVHNAIQPQWLV